MELANNKVKKLFYGQGGCIEGLLRMKPMQYWDYSRQFIKETDMLARALKKHGIDKSEVSEVEPLKIWGYNHQKTPKQTVQAWVTEGGIKTYMSPFVEQTILLFSDSRVYVYTYVVNLAYGSHTEATEEYSYKDIVNISTSEETEVLPDPNNKKKEDTFQFTVLKMTVPGEKMIYAYTPDSESESRLKAIKNKIKEKKD